MSRFKLVDVLWALCGYLADRGAVFFTSAILAGSLAPEDFSQFGFFLLTIATIASFSTLGVGVSASRLFARWNSGDLNSAEVIAPLWLVCSLVGVMAAVVSAALRSLWHPDPSKLNLLLHIVGVSAISVGIVAQGGLLGTARFRQSSAIACLSGLIVVSGGYIASRRHSVEFAQASLVVGYLVSSLLAVALVLLSFPVLLHNFKTRLSMRAAWQAVRVAGPLAFVSLLVVSANWVAGRILLGYGEKNGAAQFSAFLLGLQWVGLVQLVPGMIARAAFPSLASGSPADAMGRHHVLMRSALWALGSATLAAMIIWAGSEILVGVYGGGGMTPIQLKYFAIAAVPGACANTVGSALVAVGASRAWLMVTVIWFAVFITTAAWLRQYGAIGVAASLGVSGLTMVVSGLYFAKREGLIGVNQS